MKCYIMIGIPASGKSTLAEKIAKVENCPIISMDNIREDWYGTRQKQDENYKVWKEAERFIKEAVASNQSFIFDATNRFMRSRNAILKLLPETYETIAVYMDTPFAVALQRNEARPLDKQVPPEVIARHSYEMTPPRTEENFSKIITISAKNA